MTATMPAADAATDAGDVGTGIEALAGRMLGSIVAVMDLATIHLGRELGLYEALAGDPATPAELARRTGTDPRYLREWLEQQAVTGLLACAEASADGERRRYAVPPASTEVLVNRDSPAYLGPLAQMAVSFERVVPALLDAFRTGGGVPWSLYGDAARVVQAELNRPAYLNSLAQEWLPALPDVVDRLRAAPAARVADVGCGSGWSSIAIALAYPGVLVDGFDLDDASVADARRNADEAGVSDRVRFEVRDAAAPGLAAGAYDLVTAFETIHDMADPVGALAAMRELAGSRGAVLVADSNTPEDFVAPGDDLIRLTYASSVLMCLPTGRDAEESAATGAAMRPSTFASYARRAGFRDVEILAVEHPLWRFSRLRV